MGQLKIESDEALRERILTEAARRFGVDVLIKLVSFSGHDLDVLAKDLGITPRHCHTLPEEISNNEERV